MTKRLTKIQFVVAILVIAVCLAIALAFSAQEPAFAASESQHHVYFGSDTHGSGHAGTKLDENFLDQHVRDDGNYELPAGKYYLGGDLELKAMIYLTANDYAICLNGYQLIATKGSAICFDDGFTSDNKTNPKHHYFRLFDCHDSSCTDQNHTHNVTGKNDDAQHSVVGGVITGGKIGGVDVESGNFYMYSGTIAGNTGYYEGGGIRMVCGELRLYGGTICYNKSGWYGGGVMVGEEASLLLSGGHIRENVVTPVSDGHKYSKGGGVYVSQKTSMTFCSGEVTANSATEGGGIYVADSADAQNAGNNAKLNIYGSPVVKENNKDGDKRNIRLGNGNKIHVTGSFASGAHVELSTDKSLNDIDGFDPSKQTVKIRNIFFDESGEGAIAIFKNSALDWIPKHSHDDITFEILDNDAIKNYANNIPAGNYSLFEDITLTAPLRFADGCTLCLAGYQIKLESGDTCVINAGANFSLYDCKWGVNEEEYNHTYASAIDGASKGLRGGLITGGKASGIVADNTFNMYGGVIAGNSGEQGGGVLVHSGDFNMHGGIICFNFATDCGGGVYVTNGNASIDGRTTDQSEIRDNKAQKDGGGIYVEKGDFNMDGGRIGRYKDGSGNDIDDGNVAGGNGGGVYVASGSATANLGFISQNDAGGDGGGIYIVGNKLTTVFGYDSTGTYEGIEISYNTAAGNGGGVYASADYEIGYCRIYYNSANNGGGIYFESDNKKISWGEEDSEPEIKYNSAVANGGGAYIAGDADPHWWKIYYNKAVDGAGIYVASGTLNLHDFYFDSNNASHLGHEVYMHGGVVNFVSCVYMSGPGTGGEYAVYIEAGKMTLKNFAEDFLRNLGNDLAGHYQFGLAHGQTLYVEDRIGYTEVNLTNKVTVTYEGDDSCGVALQRTSDSTIKLTRYFAYKNKKEEDWCTDMTDEKYEIRFHTLKIVKAYTTFMKDTDQTLYLKLECERWANCKKEVELNLEASRTQDYALSCTKKGGTTYFFDLDTDVLRANASKMKPAIRLPEYYKMSEDLHTSYNKDEVEEPAGHSWAFSADGNTVVAKCSNPAHDESRDGCASEIHMDFGAPLARDGKDKTIYDGDEFELVVKDDAHFADHDAKLTTKLFFGTSNGSENQAVEEIKKAGFYVAKIYAGDSPAADAQSILEIEFEIAKAELTFELVKASDIYKAADFDDIDVKFAGLVKDEKFAKDTDYALKFAGGDALPQNAGDYAVTVVLKGTDIVANYVVQANFSKTFTVNKAKIATNEKFDAYKHGIDKVYDPDADAIKLDLPAYGTENFPFAIVGKNTATLQYIVQAYGLDAGSSSDDIAKYLAELQKGEHATDWKDYSADMDEKDPDAYCVYFKVEAANHETYYGYYMLHIYDALYTITLSKNDLELGKLQYGDAVISAADLRAKIQALTVSIIAQSEESSSVDPTDRKDELFADENFVLYLAKNGARFTGAYYEVGTYFAQAKYVDSKGGDSKYISFAWKLQGAEGDGKPTFEVAKRNLTFKLVKDSDIFKAAPFDDIDVTFTGLQNGETLKKTADYALKFNGKDDLPTNVASYEVTVELLSTSPAVNYAIADSAQHKFDITKQPVARLTTASASRTYNSDVQSVEVSEFDANLMTAVALGGSFDSATKLYSAKDAGQYVLTISLADPDNYLWATDGGDETFTFDMQKASAEIVLPTTDVYNGEYFDLLPYLKGQGSEVLYKGTHYNVMYDGGVTLPKNAGDYQVTIALVETSLTSNYVAGAAKTYTIAKASVKRPTASGTSTKYTYDTEKKSVYVMDFNYALMNENVDDGSVFVATTGEFFATNAATYRLEITIKDSTNYKWETDGDESVVFTLTIDKAQLSFDVPAGDDYDPNGRNILPTIAGEGKDMLFRGRDYNVKYDGADSLPVNVGDYQVTIELLNTELANNYIFDGQAKNYTISKKRLDKPTINDAGLVYNAQNQYASVSGFDYDTMTADSESFAGDRLNAVAAGTHSVTISLADKNNYEWADGGDDDITLSFVIGKASLTFTVGNTAQYDGSGKVAEIVLAGLKGTDTLTEGEDYTIQYNGASDLPINAGSYNVTLQLLDTEASDNYTLNDHTQQFIIDKATLAKLKSQDISSEMYGKTKTFDIEGYDAALYVLSGKNITDGKLSVKKEGEYEITVAIFDKKNYTWDDGTSDDLTITVSVIDPRPIGFEETIIMSTVIPAGFIAIAGIVLFVILKKRKKSKAAKQSEDSDDKVADSSDKGDVESSK